LKKKSARGRRGNIREGTTERTDETISTGGKRLGVKTVEEDERKT